MKTVWPYPFSRCSRASTQDLWGVSTGVLAGEGNLLGRGVAVRPANQDMWVSECLFAGSPMHRFDRQVPVPPTKDRASETHEEFVVTSNATARHRQPSEWRHLFEHRPGPGAHERHDGKRRDRAGWHSRRERIGHRRRSVERQ